jgi:hypothetical protein
MAQSIFFDVIARDKASTTFSKIGKSSATAESGLAKFGKTASKALGFIGFAGATAGVVSFLKDANAEAREAQKVGALTTQVIKSTGGAAKVTAAHVGDLANAISKKAGIDDEAIQSGENLLLTFKQIRNEAGRGNAIFDRATRAAVNLSAAGFGSISSASKMVGKALNDPIKGMTALSRAGVTFTKGQQDQIKALVATGHSLKAQKIILKEVESQVGGAAAAQATAGDKARVAWKNLEEQIGTALLPTIDKLATFAANDLVPAISKFVSGMQDGTGAGGRFADTLHDVADVGKTALKIFQAIPGPVLKFGAEGLIAYAAVQKLTAATSGFGASMLPTIARTKQFYAEMTYAETRAGALSRASGTLQTGIKNLAGAGGMMLLASSQSAANKSTATLMQTLGGAATGFAVGGPVGAAVGGLAGLMLGLATNTHKAGKSAGDSSVLWKHYADTLDDVTAAQTKMTTAAIQETIRSKGLNNVLGKYGFTNRQIVMAIRNGGPLRQRMVADLQAEAKSIADGYKAMAKKHGWSAQETIDYGKSHKARADAIQTTLKELGAVDAAVAKKREDIAATRTFTKALKELPKKVETYVKTNGLKPGISGVVELARQIKLTPKDIRILLRQNGAEGTDAQIKKVQDRARDLGHLAPVVNVTANTGRARSELSSFGRYLTEITRPRTVTVSVRHPGKPGGVGGLLTQGVSGGRGSERVVGGELRGAATQTMTVKKALAKFTDALSSVTDKLANLKDIRAGFLSTFQADNPFGVDLTEGGGANALVAFEQQQATQAAQLLADIKNVASRGLSKALISQLQAQGTSGAEALHALATGSTDQIRQLNSLNAQTTASLQAAGLLAGNTVRGGNITTDINSAAAEDARIERILKKLRHLQGDDVVVIQIDSETIIKAIKKRNKRKGVSSAGV